MSFKSDVSGEKVLCLLFLVTMVTLPISATTNNFTLLVDFSQLRNHKDILKDATISFSQGEYSQTKILHANDSPRLSIEYDQLQLNVEGVIIICNTMEFNGKQQFPKYTINVKFDTEKGDYASTIKQVLLSGPTALIPFQYSWNEEVPPFMTLPPEESSKVEFDLKADFSALIKVASEVSGSVKLTQDGITRTLDMHIASDGIMQISQTGFQVNQPIQVSMPIKFVYDKVILEHTIEYSVPILDASNNLNAIFNINSSSGLSVAIQLYNSWVVKEEASLTTLPPVQSSWVELTLTADFSALILVDSNMSASVKLTQDSFTKNLDMQIPSNGMSKISQTGFQVNQPIQVSVTMKFVYDGVMNQQTIDYSLPIHNVSYNWDGVFKLNTTSNPPLYTIFYNAWVVEKEPLPTTIPPTPKPPLTNYIEYSFVADFSSLLKVAKNVHANFTFTQGSMIRFEEISMDHLHQPMSIDEHGFKDNMPIEIQVSIAMIYEGLAERWRNNFSVPINSKPGPQTTSEMLHVHLPGYVKIDVPTSSLWNRLAASTPTPKPTSTPTPSASTLTPKPTATPTPPDVDFYFQVDFSELLKVASDVHGNITIKQGDGHWTFAKNVSSTSPTVSIGHGGLMLNKPIEITLSGEMTYDKDVLSRTYSLNATMDTKNGSFAKNLTLHLPSGSTVPIPIKYSWDVAKFTTTTPLSTTLNPSIPQVYFHFFGNFSKLAQVTSDLHGSLKLEQDGVEWTTNQSINSNGSVNIERAGFKINEPITVTLYGYMVHNKTNISENYTFVIPIGDQAEHIKKILKYQIPSGPEVEIPIEYSWTVYPIVQKEINFGMVGDFSSLEKIAENINESVIFKQGKLIWSTSQLIMANATRLNVSHGGFQLNETMEVTLKSDMLYENATYQHNQTFSVPIGSESGVLNKTLDLMLPGKKNLSIPIEFYWEKYSKTLTTTMMPTTTTLSPKAEKTSVTILVVLLVIGFAFLAIAIAISIIWAAKQGRKQREMHPTTTSRI